MKKKFALAAASAATLMMMAGPAALTVAAQDTENDVRVETGWMKHNKEFKGKGHAWGRHKQLGEDVGTRGDKNHVDDEDGDRKKGRREFKDLFKDLRNADLSATQTAEVRTAIQVRQTSLLNAVRSRMDAQIEAMETKNAAVLDAWTIEDKNARNTALEEAQEAVKEEREEIRSTFRETMKIVYETFTTSLKSILGL